MICPGLSDIGGGLPSLIKNTFPIRMTAELIMWIELKSVVSYFAMIFQQI